MHLKLVYVFLLEIKSGIKYSNQPNFYLHGYPYGDKNWGIPKVYRDGHFRVILAN